jgi:Phosphofructokinase
MAEPTTQKKFKIAVLTSGGDSAGMNAAVRAVVKGGISRHVIFNPPPAAENSSFLARGVPEAVRCG